MSAELELFGNAMHGEKLKREGMKRAADGNAHLLASAKACAVELGKSIGEVTSDDVAYSFDCYLQLGDAAGSLFRGSNWEWTGNVIKSKRASTHARMIRVWRYVGG